MKEAIFNTTIQTAISQNGTDLSDVYFLADDKEGCQMIFGMNDINTNESDFYIDTFGQMVAGVWQKMKPTSEQIAKMKDLVNKQIEEIISELREYDPLEELFKHDLNPIT